jgi:Mrp family chromosome partitioning ATPase
MENKRKLVVISSGKGGVGKTTVSLMVARELKKRGVNVGLLDVDIDTPNLTEFIGNGERYEFKVEDHVKPVVIEGIEMASIGFMVDNQMCITWDGDVRASTIDDLMFGVDWTCDVLVIDTPPGTSEELKHLISSYQPECVLVITTLHEASITDIRRTITLLKILDANITGIVSNMSTLACPSCDESIHLFGDGNGVLTSLCDVDVIAELPFVLPGNNDTRTEDEMSKIGDCVMEAIDDN